MWVWVPGARVYEHGVKGPGCGSGRVDTREGAAAHDGIVACVPNVKCKEKIYV